MCWGAWAWRLGTILAHLGALWRGRASAFCATLRTLRCTFQVYVCGWCLPAVERSLGPDHSARPRLIAESGTSPLDQMWAYLRCISFGISVTVYDILISEVIFHISVIHTFWNIFHMGYFKTSDIWSSFCIMRLGQGAWPSSRWRPGAAGDSLRCSGGVQFFDVCWDIPIHPWQLQEINELLRFVEICWDLFRAPVVTPSDGHETRHC